MKLARHSQIIRLIQEQDIETQEELAEKLNQAGYKVTQATVSRDIRELKLSKVTRPDGRSRYALLENPGQELRKKYIRVLKDAFVSMDMAQNLLVIKTVAAAAALDDMHLPEVVGCIAGDNTIMCAIHNADEAVQVMDKIRRMMESI